jgi:hypothetical protein
MSTFTAQRPSADAAGGVYAFAAPIKLEGVEPGPYVLHVQATNAKSTLSKDIPITVR